MIAQGLINSKKIAIGEFGRRLRNRKGPKVAIKAMARKLASLYWRLMVIGKDYMEKGVELPHALRKNKKREFLRLNVLRELEQHAYSTALKNKQQKNGTRKIECRHKT